jgi:uncharacterized protein (DUF1778 family)
LTLRVSESERKALQALANKKGKTLSSMLRENLGLDQQLVEPKKSKAA